MEITNQDWKLFRSRLPNWQEAYMNRLNQEYAKILSGEGTPSDKFWALENASVRTSGIPVFSLISDVPKCLTSWFCF